MIVKFLSEKIINHELTYEYVVGKRPDLKESIDSYLTNKGFSNMIQN